MVDLSLLISPPSSSEADSPKDRGLKIIKKHKENCPRSFYNCGLKIREKIKIAVQDLYIIEWFCLSLTKKWSPLNRFVCLSCFILIYSSRVSVCLILSSCTAISAHCNPLVKSAIQHSLKFELN